MAISRRSVLGAMAGFAAGRLLPAWDTDGRVHQTDTPAQDFVVGPGAWCWFQHPRASFDQRGTVWIGSTQGIGAPDPGSVDVTRVATRPFRVLERHQIGLDRVDDHTSPAVLSASGSTWAGWAPHRRADWLDLGPVRGPRTKLTRPAALAAPGRGTAYVSAHQVGAERWILYRGERFSWNLLTSPDGQRWTAEGLVIDPPPGGHRPYLVAASSGDELHLAVSDGNPSEYRGTSVSHAVIRADRSIRSTSGRSLGRVGSAPVAPSRMTRIQSGHAGRTEPTDTDAWMADLRIIGGRPVALLSVRDPWPDGVARIGRWRHRYVIAQAGPDGRWSTSHVAWAGSELYENQPDYSGLGSIHPADADEVVVSTNVHPDDGRLLVSRTDGRIHRELWSGRRGASGGWVWEPLTENSIEDNLRPVIVADPHTTAVAWMRGSYRSWTDFTTVIVLRRL